MLHTPQGKTSIFYYKRKLGVYNFTIYDIGHHEGFCFVYDQTMATKGPNEVGSFVWYFIELKVAKGIRKFVFYSDNCPSQNRNRFLLAMYVLAAARFNVEIRHVFLEKGHTQNEGDSMHSVIERKCNGHDIYSVHQWISLIKTAKRSKTNPYKVVEVNQDMVFDFKDLVSKQNWDKDVNKVTVPWSKIRMVSSTGSDPGMLRYHLTLDGEGSLLSTKSKSAGRPVNLETFALKKAYTDLLPITDVKYRDLNEMCDKNAVPQEYHSYYRQLPKLPPPAPKPAAKRKGGSAPATQPKKSKKKKIEDDDDFNDSAEEDTPDSGE